MNFEDFKIDLISTLEAERDLLIIQGRKKEPETLFSITDENDKLYQHIQQRFKLISIEKITGLISQMCKEHNVQYFQNGWAGQHWFHFDAVININWKLTKVKYITSPNSLNTAVMREIALEINNMKESAVIVFLIKGSFEGYEAAERISRRISSNYNAHVRCVLFEDFIEELFGVEEKISFQDAMVDFKEQLHLAIGYQVTELCSQRNMQKLRERLDKEICDFDYESVKRNRFAEALEQDPNARDLNNRNYNLIKEMFISSGRYKLLLGNSDFAQSFLTTEWLLKKYFSVEALDNTFIVAGYLKSIEQLLWRIISIIGQGRTIKNVVISQENMDDIDNTLGALQYFLSSYSNDDLFNSSFGNSKHFIMNYLRTQISDWRQQYRNGYFHKHNLTDINKISAIKEETYFLYMLILGAINLSSSEIRRLRS